MQKVPTSHVNLRDHELIWYFKIRIQLSRENDYNYISLYHSDLGGCGGQNSLAINEYMSKLLEKRTNRFAFKNG